MSHQYPGPQQPYQGGPAPYQPPPPPKKGMSAWAIVGITLGGIFAFLLIVGIAFGDSTPDKSKPSDKAAAEPSTPKAAPSTKSAVEEFKEGQERARKYREASKALNDAEAKKDGQFNEGDWIVGEDMPEGMYTSEGARPGAFEFCSITTKPTDSAKFPQIKSANKGERIIITLTKADGVVTIQGCEPLTLRK